MTEIDVRQYSYDDKLEAVYERDRHQSDPDRVSAPTRADRETHADAYQAFKTKAPDVFPGSEPLVTFDTPAGETPS